MKVVPAMYDGSHTVFRMEEGKSTAPDVNVGLHQVYLY